MMKRVRKSAGRLAGLIHRVRYDQAAAIAEQDRQFAQLGLSRPEGLAIIEALLSSHSELVGSMRSEHLVLFGAMSRTMKVSRILEIGTYDGKCAAVLANLFPAARVDTIDLPDSHAAFTASYNRQDDAIRAAFIGKRNELLSRHRNIHFEQFNSVALAVESPERYDLIWVDGDHGYPAVAIDIANAFRLVNPTGLVLCDDVRKVPPRDHGPNSIYGSVGAYRTLESLRDAGIIKFSLVYKRLDARSSADPKRRKFVAVGSLVRERQ